MIAMMMENGPFIDKLMTPLENGDFPTLESPGPGSSSQQLHLLGQLGLAHALHELVDTGLSSCVQLAGCGLKQVKRRQFPEK